MEALTTIIGILDSTIKEKAQLLEKIQELEARIKEITTPQITTLADLCREDFAKLPAPSMISFEEMARNKRRLHQTDDELKKKFTALLADGKKVSSSVLFSDTIGINWNRLNRFMQDNPAFLKVEGVSKNTRYSLA